MACTVSPTRFTATCPEHGRFRIDEYDESPQCPGVKQMSHARWEQVIRTAQAQRAEDAYRRGVSLPLHLVQPTAKAMVADDDHGMEMLARLFLWATFVFAVVAVVALRMFGVL
jgi:hypothetical protein